MQLDGACSGLRPLGSSAERMQVHLDFLTAAQHPHGGVQTPRGDRHLPSTHQLPVPGEKHLEESREVAVRTNTQTTIRGGN